MENSGSHHHQPQQYLLSSVSLFTGMMISLAIVLVITIAIIAYHLILFKYRRQIRRGSRSIRGGNKIEGGIEPHVLESIPPLNYSVKDFKAHDCAICLGEFHENDKVRLLPSCGHVFHVICVDEWFSGHKRCPICRTLVNSKSLHDDQANIIQIESNQILPYSRERLHDCFVSNGRSGSGYHQEIDRVGSSSWISNNGCSSRSNVVLQHSLSLVISRERPRERDLMKFTRSFSMNHSIDVRRDHDQYTNYSSTWTKDEFFEEIKSLEAQSIQQFDLLPLRIGLGNIGTSNFGQSTVLLRHSVSLVLSRESPQKLSLAELKRSLSVNQSSIVIDIQEIRNEYTKTNISTSSKSGVHNWENKSFKARLRRQLVLMPSRLWLSSSQLRIGHVFGVGGNYQILPY